MNKSIGVSVSVGVLVVCGMSAHSCTWPFQPFLLGGKKELYLCWVDHQCSALLSCAFLTTITGLRT
jgi:hypothetical protein